MAIAALAEMEEIAHQGPTQPRESEQGHTKLAPLSRCPVQEEWANQGQQHDGPNPTTNWGWVLVVLHWGHKIDRIFGAQVEGER